MAQFVKLDVKADTTGPDRQLIVRCDNIAHVVHSNNSTHVVFRSPMGPVQGVFVRDDFNDLAERLASPG